MAGSLHGCIVTQGSVITMELQELQGVQASSMLLPGMRS